jgi:hypothetical protein
MKYLIVVSLFFIIVIAAITFLDKKYRFNNSINMDCKNSDVQVLLISNAKNNPDSLSDTLFTIIQNARCPRSLKITLIEAVPELERQSTTLMMYKDKASARGSFFQEFMERVTVIQLLEGSEIFTEAAALAPSERRLTLVVTDGVLLEKFWDLDIESEFDGLPGRPGGLFVGGHRGPDEVLKGAYTSVSKFIGQSPIVITRPLFKDSGSLRCIWASWPMVLKTSNIKFLKGQSAEEAALRLTHQSGSAFWTGRPRAENIAEWTPINNYESFFNPFFHETDKLLGLLEKTALASEIIAKFGSLGNFQWAKTS